MKLVKEYWPLRVSRETWDASKASPGDFIRVGHSATECPPSDGATDTAEQPKPEPEGKAPSREP